MKKIEIKSDPEIVELEINIDRLLAQQNADLDARVLRTKLGYEKSQVTESQEGTPETELGPAKKKNPAMKRKTDKKRVDTHQVLCHCFRRDSNNGDGEHIYAELGGPWGHMKRTLHRVADAMNLAMYKKPSLGLIRFQPELVDLGPSTKIDYTDVLEPRSRGKSRELTAYETARNRTVKMQMQISNVCPLTGEEISALLTGLRDYDGFGPSSRGLITNIKTTSHSEID